MPAVMPATWEIGELQLNRRRCAAFLHCIFPRAKKRTGGWRTFLLSSQLFQGTGRDTFSPFPMPSKPPPSDTAED